MASAHLMELSKTVLTLVILAVASYMDLKTREIDDRTWIVLISLGLPLTFVRLYNLWGSPARPLVIVYIVSVLMSLILGWGLYYLRLMGGADAKAIMALGAIEIPSYTSSVLGLIPIAAILVNSVIFSLSVSALLIIRNLIVLIRDGNLFEGIEATLPQKILAFFVLTPVSMGELRRRPYAYSIAERVVDGKRKIVIHFRIEEDSVTIPEGNGRIWVSPLIPMIIYIALGFAYYKASGCILDLILLGMRKII